MKIEILSFTIIIGFLCFNSIDIQISVNDNTILLPITLGIPKQDLNVIFDTGSLVFWIKEYNDNPHQATFDSGFEYKLSSSFTSKNDSETIRLPSQSLIGIESNDNLSIGTISLNQYPFILVDHSNLPKQIDGYFGFAYISSISFLSTLTSQHIIRHQILSLDISNELITIGSLSKDIQNDLQHFSYCKVNQTIQNIPNKSWNCFLTGVYAERNITNYIADEILIEFNSGIKVVLVSYGLLYSLYTYYIPKSNQGKCSLITSKKWFTVECNEYFDLAIMDDLKLKFGFMTLLIPKEELFINQGMAYHFVFRTHAKHDYWKIGFPLLKHFKVVFDVDKSIIGFYSRRLVINEYNIDQDDVFTSYQGKKKSIIILSNYIANCIVDLMGIGLNIYLTYWFKNVNKEKK